MVDFFRDFLQKKIRVLEDENFILTQKVKEVYKYENPLYGRRHDLILIRSVPKYCFEI